MIPEKITTIEQRKFLCGYQRFEIREDGEMEVIVRRFWMHNQFKFPLWALNPSPIRVKFVQAGSLVGAIVFALFMAGIIAGMIVSRERETAFALLFPLLFFGGVLGVHLETPDAVRQRECVSLPRWKRTTSNLVR